MVKMGNFAVTVLTVLSISFSYTFAQEAPFTVTPEDKTTIKNDLDVLLKDINSLKLSQSVSDVEVFGKFAYILATSRTVNLWAAARMGSGKICAFTDNQFCKMSNAEQPADNAKVIRNCIRWVANNADGSKSASSIIGMLPAEMTYNQGFVKSGKATFQTEADLTGISFVVMPEAKLLTLSELQLAALKNYIKHGGGLVACNNPWEKSYESMNTNPANTLLLEAGLRWNPDLAYATNVVNINRKPLGEFWTYNPWYISRAIVQGNVETVKSNAMVQKDVNLLTTGVNSLKAVSRPFHLIASGKTSVALARTKTVNVWAASFMGRGKVCAFSTDTICKMTSTDQPMDNNKAFQNCIKWVTNNTSNSVGMVPKEMSSYKEGFVHSDKKSFETAADLSGINFVVAHQTNINSYSPSQRNALVSYVKNGGGLIVCNAHWVQKREDMPNNAGNLILKDSGLKYDIDTEEPGTATVIPFNQQFIYNDYYMNEIIASTISMQPLPNMTYIVDKFIQEVWYLNPADSYTSQVVQSVGGLKILELMCSDEFQFPVYQSLVPTQYVCVKYVNHIRSYLPLNVDHPVVKAAWKIPAYPTTSRQLQTMNITIPITHKRYLSTGVFAWPGSYLDVTVPESILDKGFELKIGIHTDLLWGNEYYGRWPDITDSIKITKSKNFRFWTFGGGPIYIFTVHPKFVREKTKISIIFTGEIVRYPWFKLGRDTESDWQAMLSANVAPFAEIEADYSIFTLPTAQNVLNTISNITELTLWQNDVLLKYQDLSGNTRNDYKQRIVIDLQIKYGTAHAGYPIMVFDATPVRFNQLLWTKSFLRPTSNVKTTNQYQTEVNYWGLFHEVGHNWQLMALTPMDMMEEVANIFTLYVEEFYPNGPYRFGDNSFDPSTRSLTTGYPSKLGFFVELRDAFGWEPFRQIFRLFEKNQTLKDTGRDQAENNWLQYFSPIVKRNVSPLMDMYKIIYSANVKISLNQYPAMNPNAIINCKNAAFPSSPCISVVKLSETSFQIQLVLWARINNSEALEMRFIGNRGNDAVTGFHEAGSSVWRNFTFNAETKVLRIQPSKRLNADESHPFSITTMAGFKYSEVYAKIINIPTSKTMHVKERVMENPVV